MRLRRGASSAAPTGPRDLGWRPAIVLMLVALVDRIETGVIPGVLTLLQDEWGFSDTAGGAIATAVTIAGLIVVLPAGYLADRANRKNLIAIMVACWSLIITGSALAPTFAFFFVTRVGLGVADSVDTPSALSLMGDFFDAKRRARAYGLQRMCYLIGGAIGTLMGGVVGGMFGWRMAFFSMVIPGLIVAALVWRLPEPVRGAVDRRSAAGEEAPPASAPPQAELAVSAGGAGQLLSDIRALMGVRTIFYVYFGLMCLFMGIGGIFFWLPAFYTRTFDLAPGAAASLAAAIAIVGVVGGTFIGGSVGDRMYGAIKGARVVIGGIALLAGSTLLGVAFVIGSLGLQATVLGLSVVIMAMASPNLTAAIADVLPAHQRGIGFALVTFLMSGGGAFGPLGVGFASDQTGSLTLAFYVLVVPMLIGSLVVMLGRRTFDDDVRRAVAQARSET